MAAAHLDRDAALTRVTLPPAQVTMALSSLSACVCVCVCV